MSITLNPKAIKVNKREAFNLVTRLKQGDSLTPLEIDGLLLYFAPGKFKQAKTAMQWVAKAAAKSDPRKCLERIYVADGKAFASDGARIHVAKVDEAPGWYDPSTLLRLEGVDDKPYRFKDVLNQARSAKDQSGAFVKDMVPGVIRTSKSGKVEKTLRDENTKAVFFADQLLEATNHAPGATLSISPAGGSWRAHGRSEYGEYVVMGLIQD